MDDSFIPLIPRGRAAPAAGSAPVRGLATPSGPANSGFQPLAASKHPEAPHSGCAQSQPTVTLRHEGERVTQITIRCSCGQVLTLQCEYPSSLPGLSAGT